MVPHEADFERAFYQRLEQVGFAGHLLLDDIYLNEPMQDFWHGVRRPKRDVTHLGHWSGTGLVSFGGEGAGEGVQGKGVGAHGKRIDST